MSGKKKMHRGEAFDAKYREKPRAIAKYLNDALSTGNPVRITKAIGDMVRVQGVTRVSQETGLARPNLYRSFRGEIRPSFETVLDVLAALDIQLIAKPVRRLVKIRLSRSAPSDRLKAARESGSAGTRLKAKR